MTAAAAFLGGARSRLLPASVPFRFFATAAVFHIALWIFLLVGADDAVQFDGGLGPALAGLHMLTLGVLAGTAMGAALQLLPVATRQALRAVWPARLSFWLFASGTALLGYGMAAGTGPVLAMGGALAAAGIGFFAFLLTDNLRRAQGLPLVVAHGWLALLSLAALVVLGLLLIADFNTGILQNHATAARAHVILAGYGFMGMLVLGFSQVLVPMFGLSQAPGPTAGRWVLGLSTGALAAATFGAVMDDQAVMLAAAAAGLGAAGAHLWSMAQTMKTRMRKHLGLSFVLVRVAWVLLPLSILAGALDLLGVLGPRGGTLFGFMLFFGWLLTFLMGILQRILPFLASMHTVRGGGKPRLVSELTMGAALRVHAVCHFGALGLGGAAIVLGEPGLMQAGAAAGLAGALAFAWFTAQVILRMAKPAAPAATRPKNPQK